MTVLEFMAVLRGADPDAEIVLAGRWKDSPLVVKRVRYGGPVVLKKA